MVVIFTMMSMSQRRPKSQQQNDGIHIDDSMKEKVVLNKPIVCSFMSSVLFII